MLVHACVVWHGSIPVSRGVSTGHRASVTTVDVHPFGVFFCSASADTNVKVWDIRSREPLATYKGHSRGVTKTRFSPDGKLIASGDESGVLKVTTYLFLCCCWTTYATESTPHHMPFHLSISL
jgi:WD40 repeat protein